MNKISFFFLAITAMIGATNAMAATDLSSYNGTFWMQTYSGSTDCGSDSLLINTQGTELVMTETCYSGGTSVATAMVFECNPSTMTCLVDPNVSQPRNVCLGIQLTLQADGHITDLNPCTNFSAEYYKPVPAITVNSTVVTIATASLYSGTTVVGQVDANKTFIVTGIQGSWASLKNTDGSAVKGWISLSNLKLVTLGKS